MELKAIRGFFVRFRGAVIALVLLVLGASGAVFFLENRREAMSEQEGDTMYFALKGAGEEGIKGLESLSNGKGASAHLAKFRLANAYIKERQDVSAARDVYEKLATDKSLVRELRELAEYMSAVLSISLGETGTELESKIVRLASSKDGVYKSSAKEALIALKLKNKDTDAAVGIMREILGDASSSPEVRRNAESLLRVYGS